MTPTHGMPREFLPSGPQIAPPITTRTPQLTGPMPGPGPAIPIPQHSHPVYQGHPYPQAHMSMPPSMAPGDYPLRQYRDERSMAPMPGPVGPPISQPQVMRQPPRSPNAPTGLVAGPSIGQAMQAMHAHPLHPPPSGPGPMQYEPPPPASARPVSPTQEHRLRVLESAITPLTALPNQLNAMQEMLADLARNQEAVSYGNRGSRSRGTLVEVSEVVWDNYQRKAWPLTPWLIGLRHPSGLQALVGCYLGKRTLMDKQEDRRRDVESVGREVLAEIGRLSSEKTLWTKEDIRALGVFAYVRFQSSMFCFL